LTESDVDWLERLRGPKKAGTWLVDLARADARLPGSWAVHFSVVRRRHAARRLNVAVPGWLAVAFDRRCCGQARGPYLLWLLRAAAAESAGLVDADGVGQAWVDLRERYRPNHPEARRGAERVLEAVACPQLPSFPVGSAASEEHEALLDELGGWMASGVPPGVVCVERAPDRLPRFGKQRLVVGFASATRRFAPITGRADLAMTVPDLWRTIGRRRNAAARYYAFTHLVEQCVAELMVVSIGRRPS
jgi:hypothetical protein